MNDLKLQIRLEMQTAQGEAALKRFEAAIDAALGKLKRPADVQIIKQLAAEVEAGKKKLDEVPAQWRRDVETVNRIARGIKLLDDAGIKQSHAQIKQSIDEIKARFAALKRSGVLSHAELAQAAARAREKIRALGEEMNGASRQAGTLAGAFGKLQVVLSGLAGFTAGNRLFAVADDMAQLSARLALVEGGSLRAKDRLNDLFAIAAKGQTDVSAIGDAYVRFANTMVGIGRSTDEALKLTEALTLGLRVSGAGAQETAAVMRQLGQALQRGKFSGDEFASVSENGGKVLDYLARALGVSRGRLLEMSQAGELTVDMMLKLNDALEQIRKDAEAMPKTVSGAFEVLSNAAKRWVSESEGVGLAGKMLISVFHLLGEHLGKVIDILMLAGFAIIVARFGAIVNAVRTLAASLGLIAGLPLLGRVLMIIATAATLALEPLKNLWRTLTDGENITRASRALENMAATFGKVQGAAQSAASRLSEAFDAESRRAADSVKGIQETFRSLATNAKTALDRRLADVEASYQQQVRAAHQAAQSEAQAISSGVQAVLDAEHQKLAIVQEHAARLDAAWRTAYGSATEIARASGQDVQAIEREGLQARLAIYGEIESAYRATVDRLIAEEHRHLDAVRRAEEERRNLRLSVEDRIREIARQGMDERSAYADRLLQIEEKQAAARKALQRGDFELAKKIAQESISLAERSASVSDKVVPKQQAAAAAIAQIRESAQIADQALAGLSLAHQEAADAAAAGAQQAKKALASVRAEIDAMLRQMQGVATVQLHLKTDEAEAAIARLKSLAQAKKIAVRLQATAADALETVNKLKDDIGNAELWTTVRINTDRVRDDIARVEHLAKKARIDLGVSFEEAKDQLATFRADAEAMLARPTKHSHTVEPNTAKAQAAIDELKKPTSSTHTVHVHTVERRASGGLVGGIPHFASGGHVWRRITGRVFGPGTSTSDSIPAMLSAGEYVIRADAVRRYGVALLDAINGGRAALMSSAMPKIANAIHAPSRQPPAIDDELRILLQAPGHEPVRVRSDRDEALRLVRLLRSAGVNLGVA